MKKLFVILGFVLIFPVLVAAQMATATATSTPVVTVDTATTSIDITFATSTTQTVAATTTTATPDTSTDASTSIPAATSTGTVADQISALENTYYQANGVYLQVLPGNILPSYETGTVTADLGSAIPDNVRVDIYDAPGGKGFQVTYQDTSTQHSVGYGPEAISRTYSSPLPIAAAATSTAAISTSTVPTTIIAPASTASSTATSSPAGTLQSASTTTSDSGASSTIGSSTAATSTQ